MARGKLNTKKCKKGYQKTKKNRNCVNRLNPKAKTFSMKKSTNSLKNSFKIGINTV